MKKKSTGHGDEDRVLKEHYENRNTFASSHAALKEFFPLETGDGVVHTYDVLHGVDVDPSLNSSRTSLIIWFVDKFDNEEGERKWLLRPSDNDHVKQFILALASECNADSNQNKSRSSSKNEIHELYIKSAQQGNVFALNSLAEMCDTAFIPS